MSHIKSRPSYKEASESPMTMEFEDPNCLTIKLPKPKITYLGSLYESGRQTIYEDEYSFGLLQVNELDIDNNIERIIGVLETKDGVTNDNAIVRKSKCPYEFYIGTFKSATVLKKALDIGWSNEEEISKIKVPRGFHLKYKKNTILWYSNINYICRCKGKCKCALIPRFFKIKILKPIRPSFIGEMDPPYYCYVFGNFPNIGKYLWAHEISLYVEKPSEEQPFEEIEDLFYWWVLKCPKYKDLCLLGASNIPAYVDIQSPYFQRKDIYLNDDEKIRLHSLYNVLFEDEYKTEINFLLTKTFAQSVKICKSSKNINIRGTEINLMKHGICATPFKMEYSYKPYLNKSGANFSYSKKCIALKLDSNAIKQIREKELVIQESKLDNDDKEKIILNGDIKLKWSRREYVLYVSSFSYVCNNRHVVVNDENEEEEKLDEDDILDNIEEDDMY